MNPRRRLLLATPLLWMGAAHAGPQATSPGGSDPAGELDAARGQWMRAWMDTPTKSLHGPLKLQRFVEPIYVLLAPITWKNSGSPSLGALSVTAPKGFVTDMASIPRVFYSLLQPDGNYAYAAIIHDYLYWSQHLPRQTADEVFREALADLDIAAPVRTILVTAVSRFGEGAWRNNAAAKAAGEQRVLKVLPDNAVARWADWKARPGVFR